ncbi:hypothetical protein I4U23_019849 [Adineta vaga]|nr:hypothetical protein I4U23_019849 [Adineta vaga]
MLNENYGSSLSPSVDLQTQLTDILCFILFIMGIVGNIFGLLFFFSIRRRWTISSDYIGSAISSSITNLLCLIRYSSILYSVTRHPLHQLVQNNWWACKIYEFSFSFRVISAWIILFWMFERLMCVSSGLRTFFNRWLSFKFNFMIPITTIIVIIGCVVGPSVFMFEPQLFYDKQAAMIKSTSVSYCGLSSNSSVWWQIYFYHIGFGGNHHTIRCFLSELIPAGLIIFCNTFIIYNRYRTNRRFHQIYSSKLNQSRLQSTSWMNIVLLLHSSLFLLPLLVHILVHFFTKHLHGTLWTSFSIMINCSLNFYLYCLFSKAFRNQIYRHLPQTKKNSSCTFQEQHCHRIYHANYKTRIVYKNSAVK